MSTTNYVLDITLPEKPIQPPSSAIATQICRNMSLKFQDRWFALYPWLHYVDSLQGVLCICCARAYQLKLLDMSQLSEGAFMFHGFKNWKKHLKNSKHLKVQQRIDMQQCSSSIGNPLCQLNP